MTVGTTNILSSITNLQNNTSNYVLKNTNNTMTSNLTTTGDIQGRIVSATSQLNAGGSCIFNSTLTVMGVVNLNSTSNFNGVVNITAGRGRDNTGGQLNIIGTGDLVYNTSALQFGGSGWASHLFELSWLGNSHYMRGSSTASWYQTMMIE